MANSGVVCCDISLRCVAQAYDCKFEAELHEGMIYQVVKPLFHISQAKEGAPYGFNFFDSSQVCGDANAMRRDAIVCAIGCC